ncbi:ZDBF2 protein, partial [Rhinopomastus cyanomelas]|nr:ZDBF2 protein [Rhinopomastus cyanomelas]
MFDRIKPSDEASASSAQGILFASFSLHTRGQEHLQPEVSTMQNRQGYCSCCHIHYSNLEQHVFSSQHRHFTTSCKSRVGASSLMERFLQDVLQHHPNGYHDNRPSYDDLPLPVTPEATSVAHLSPEKTEKKRNRDRWEISSKDQESSGETHSSAQLCHKSTKKTQAFTQNLKRRQEHVTRISHQSVGICSTEKWDTLKDAQTVIHSHESQLTAVSHAPQRPSVSPLRCTFSVN